MKREHDNRILALLKALERGQARFTQLKDAHWQGKTTEREPAGEQRSALTSGRTGDSSSDQTALPAFAVDEIYALPAGERFRKLPSDRSGVQLDLDVAALRPAGEAAEHTEDSGKTPQPYAPAEAVTAAWGAAGRIGAGDNLDYMAWLLREKDMAGKIQLIYVDPPFFSGARYLASVQITGRDGKKSPVLKVGAYEDKWGHDLGDYLEMLAVRFYLMRELLADTGCLWVHMDWHGSHYVKMMLDEIFGHERFINEVAWTYKSGGSSKRSFAKKHDTLLFYAKTDAYKFHQLKEKSYNRDMKPYRFKGVEEFQDARGWYTMVNMKDVWSIDMVGRTSSERMGYATQKPEKLLERIVDACTDEGDLCADFFAGTGTLGAVCGRRGRRWILCDEGSAAIGSQILRMADLADGRTPFLVERPIRPYETRPQTMVQAAVRDGHLMLDRCQPDLTQVQERDRETVMKYINENSLDLVSFWSLDMCRQDGVREAAQGAAQGPAHGRIHLGRRLLSGDDIIPVSGEGSIRIVGYDIFGGRFEWMGQAERTE